MKRYGYESSYRGSREIVLRNREESSRLGFSEEKGGGKTGSKKIGE